MKHFEMYDLPAIKDASILAVYGKTGKRASIFHLSLLSLTIVKDK